MPGTRKRPPAEPVALAARSLKAAKLFLILLCLSLSLFPVFHVLTNLLLIQPNCAHTISSALERITQVRHSLQTWVELLNNLIAVFPFKIPVSSDINTFGGMSYYQMDMIFLYI